MHVPWDAVSDPVCNSLGFAIATQEDMVWSKRFQGFQFAVLFLGTVSITVGGGEASAGVAAATNPPSPPIAHPPALPPVNILPPPPQKLPLAIEGVVYCRSRKLPGYDESHKAAPLPGVSAKVLCYEKKRGAVAQAKTDKRGYFLIQSPKLVGFRSRSCKVVLTSPFKYCKKLVYPGLPYLRFERILEEGNTAVSLFTTGFLLYESA